MKTLALLTSLLLLVPASQAAEKPADNRKEAAHLKANPNDVKAYRAYMTATSRLLRSQMKTNPAQAEKLIAEMEGLLKKLKPTNEEAKTYLGRLANAPQNYRQLLELERTPLAEYRKRLQANPDDSKALTGYYRKASGELYSLSRTKPAEAEKKLKALKIFLAGIKEKSKDAEAQPLIERYLTATASFDQRIESGKKLLGLIGKDAMKLDVQAWVNGPPLAPKDLKGKVVLLDFWAVWCGPCIATFPHLREWQDKYAGKGLVIIGITRYYNYTWNENAERAMRAQGKVAPGQEHGMLQRFAAHHQLKHRFAIQKDREISSFYGGTGIPQAVVIDRQGKIRLIRVGSGEQNAKDIERAIRQALEPGAAN